MTTAAPQKPPDLQGESLTLTLTGLISERIAPQEVPPEGWERLIALAGKEAVLPMLHARIRAKMPELASSGVWQKASALVIRTAAKLSALLGAQDEVSKALNAAGIEVIWLKGAALCHTVYPQKTLRPMVDGDFLVPFERREQALHVVEGLGFHPSYHPSLFVGVMDNERAGALYHHYVLQRGEALLELHFSLFPDPALLPGEAMGWFWSQTEAITPLLRAFTPEAQILHLAAHLFRHHHDLEPDLLHLLDFHLLLKARPINWTLVLDQAVELGWTQALEQALTAAGALYGTSYSSEVLKALQTRRPAHEQALLQQQAAGLGSFGKNWRRFQGFSALQKLNLILRAFFPTPENLRRRFEVPIGRSLIGVYPRLWTQLIGKAVRWLLRRGIGQG